MPELFSNEIDELSTDDLRNIRGKLTLLLPCHCFEFVDVQSCELVKHFGSSPPVVPYLDRLKSVMAAQDVYGGDGFLFLLSSYRTVVYAHNRPDLRQPANPSRSGRKSDQFIDVICGIQRIEEPHPVE